jgi:GT2 family glycosyltransferase
MNKINKCKIGVVIVNFNSEHHLYKCIDAIKQQEISFEKGIVIDNDPDNKSHSIDDLLPDGWEYIWLGYNAGFAEANNIGVEKLHSCQWVALVNPDAYLHPAWLKHMVDATNRYKNYTFFSSKLLSANEPSITDGVGDVYHMSGLVWRAGHGDKVIIHREREVFSPCAAAAIYSRKAFINAGGLDPDFFCYAEDVDLGFRLRLLGYRCLLVTEAIAYHVGSTSSGGRHSSFSVYHGHRNIPWVFIKNMPFIFLWLFLPLHFALNIFTICWFIFKGHGKIIIKAKIDAIRGLPKMIAKRKIIQNRRKIKYKTLFSLFDKRLLPDRRYNLTLSLQKSLGFQSQGYQRRSRSKLLRVLGNAGSVALKAFLLGKKDGIK